MTARSHSRMRSKEKKARATALAIGRNKRGEVRRDDERERSASKGSD